MRACVRVCVVRVLAREFDDGDGDSSIDNRGGRAPPTHNTLSLFPFPVFLFPVFLLFFFLLFFLFFFFGLLCCCCCCC